MHEHNQQIHANTFWKKKENALALLLKTELPREMFQPHGCAWLVWLFPVN
jgi:hypothetical protein